MKITPKTQTITYFDTVDPNSRKTILSKKITAPFKTKKFRASFPAGTNRLNKLRFFIVSSPDAPTLEPPVGTDLLFSLGQVNYITGSDNSIEFEHEVINRESNVYIAVHAENTDAFAHTIECQVTIEFIELTD